MKGIMMKKLYSIIILILIAALLIPVSFADGDEPVVPPLDRSAEKMIIGNEKLEVGFDEVNQIISITDLRNGHKWYTDMDPSKLGKKPNKIQSQMISSLINLYYSPVDSKNSEIILSKDYTVKISEANAEKAVLSVVFNGIDVELDLVLTLEADEIVLDIPFDKIIEGEGFKIIEIEPFPFLGSTNDADEGYYVYPNGCGELYRFGDEKFREFASKTYTISLYSDPLKNLSQRIYSGNSGDFDKMLPVFGVKLGDNAFSAYAEAGDFDSSIVLSPSGVKVNSNRIYFAFKYRYSYEVEGSDIDISGGGSYFPLAVLFDEEMISGNRTIRYSFLEGEDADYSAMADRVRENLTKKEVLTKKEPSDEPKMYLDMMMGLVEKKFLFKFFNVTTTFDEAEMMLDELLENNVKNMEIGLKGWSKKGFFSGNGDYPAARKLGGTNGLESLAQYAENNGIPLRVYSDFIDLTKGYDDFKVLNDTAKDPNKFAYTEGKGKYMLLSPKTMYKTHQKLVEYLSDAGVSGIVYDGFGDFIYNDFNDYKTTREENFSIWKENMDLAKTVLGSSAVSGGNAYVLGNADVIYGVGAETYMLPISERTIPFYQMVVHGSVDYTWIPGNLFYDQNRQLLKMIEYGYSPYYELTYRNPNVLGNTHYPLFTSSFNVWNDNLVEVYDIYRDDLNGIWNKYMIKHEEILEGLFATTYEDGTVVYVNYNDYDSYVEGNKVESLSYLVLSEAGGAQ